MIIIEHEYLEVFGLAKELSDFFGDDRDFHLFKGEFYYFLDGSLLLDPLFDFFDDLGVHLYYPNIRTS